MVETENQMRIKRIILIIKDGRKNGLINLNLSK